MPRKFILSTLHHCTLYGVQLSLNVSHFDAVKLHFRSVQEMQNQYFHDNFLKFEACNKCTIFRCSIHFQS